MKNTIRQKQPFKHQLQQPYCNREQGKHHQGLKKHHGIAYIQLTFGNTFITITNNKGEKRIGASSGCLKGFKGSRRSDKYAAQATAEHVAQAAIRFGIGSVEVRIKGIGLAKKGFLLKGLKDGGLIITKIRDVTSVPYNGCRPPKKRRV